MGKRIVFCILAAVTLIANILIATGTNSTWLKIALSLLAVIFLVEAAGKGVGKEPFRILIFIGALFNFSFLWIIWSAHPFVNIGAMLLCAGHWSSLFTKETEGS